MTTKRKTILATLAKSGPTILDDLVDATGWVRKNLQDNLKACVDEGLVERTKDDVTGLPAYKLSTKGQQWLKNNANSSVTTQAGSGDVTPAAAHCATSLASDSPGKGAAVIEPPAPEHSSAAVRSDDSALSKSVTEFCGWLGKRLGGRIPLNLRESKDFIANFMRSNDANAEQLDEQTKQIATLRAENVALKSLNEAMPGFGAAYQAQQWPTGYVIMPDYPDMTIHQSLASARLEAEGMLDSDDVKLHVVSIVDTAELAVTWKGAAA